MTIASPFAPLAAHTFLRLTTYRKSGAPVHTPVWFVQNGGCLYVWTERQSGKAKRIRNNPHVTLAPSDARGTPLGESLEGQARQLNSAQGAAIVPLFIRKYGWQYRAFRLATKLRRAELVTIEISPDPKGTV